LPKLKDIQVKLLSIVETPATRRKFCLIKEAKDMDKLIELLKSILGEVPEEAIELVKKLDAAAAEALKKALEILSKYVGDFPDDVKEAVATLARAASYGYGYPKPKGGGADDAEKEKLERQKERADFEKELLEKVAALIGEAVRKSADPLTEKVGAVQADVKKSVEGLEARLKKIEETPGIKKSLEGQDGDPPPSKWPSFFAQGGE